MSLAEQPISLLTAVLILITAWYAWNTARATRIHQKEFELRIRPLLEARLTTLRTKNLNVSLYLESSNASAKLLSVKGNCVGGVTADKDKIIRHSVEFQLQGQFVHPGKERVFHTTISPWFQWGFIGLSILYEDVVDLKRYEILQPTSFGNVPDEVQKNVKLLARHGVVTDASRRWRIFERVRSFGSALLKGRTK